MPNSIKPAGQRLWDSSLQPALQGLGIDVRRYPPTPPLGWEARAFEAIARKRESFASPVRSNAGHFVQFCFANATASKGQLLQDLFVLFQLEERREGFFVEFGAANGIDLSNSYLLETQYGWRGILAEPARGWRDQLKANRRCIVDHRCVWRATGEELSFLEADAGEFSTLQSLADKDRHAEIRQSGTTYPVETITLNDLLTQHAAPPVIDYLSLDTEGSELQILEAFDFSRWQIQVITVEHNFSANRDGLYQLLTKNGFRRVFTELSLFDDWYVSGQLPD